MELVQPLASSAVRFLQARPNQVFVPDMIRGVHERYRFWRVPQNLEEYTRTEGAEFQTGLFSGTVIDAFRVYNNGIVADAKAHTDALDDFLDDLMGWAGSEFGLEYDYLAPVARSYTSTVEVRSSSSLSRYVRELAAIGARLTEMVAGYGHTIGPYEFTTLIAATDPEKANPLKPGRFLFDRRAGKPFESGVYFSEAPVSTAEHMELLEKLEAIFASA